jgi:hypothetical protein
LLHSTIYTKLIAHPTATSLPLAIDEDQLSGSERNHTTEQVAYWVVE